MAKGFAKHPVREAACWCAACKLGLPPFTVEHFTAWAAELTLDNGRPWIVEPFQASFLADVFAGYQECWLIVAEANAKSTLVSGIALHHIEHAEGARVPVAASSRDQGHVLFERSEGFVRRSGIGGRFDLKEGMRRVNCLQAHSRMQIYAADDRTGDGIIPTLALLEELHRHRDLGLYRTWRGKLDKRGAQLVGISTAGAPGGEFEEAREAMRREAVTVERDETFGRYVGRGYVLHDWAVPEGGDVEDLELVARANPLKAVTVASLRAKRASPTWRLDHWSRFTCNLPTRGADAAITEAEWHAAQADEEIPPRVPVWLGLDVAWKWDCTAAVPLWVKSAEHRQLGESRILEPPRDGSTLDPNDVKRAIYELNGRNPLATVVMDMSRAEDLAAWISDELDVPVVDRGQSNAFAVADFDRFLEGLRAGWLKHSGDQDLTRHVLNAVTRILPGGEARFDRPKESRKAQDQNLRVIDGLTAAAMVNSAVAVDLEAEDEPGEIMVAWG